MPNPGCNKECIWWLVQMRGCRETVPLFCTSSCFIELCTVILTFDPVLGNETPSEYSVHCGQSSPFLGCNCIPAATFHCQTPALMVGVIPFYWFLSVLSAVSHPAQAAAEPVKRPLNTRSTCVLDLHGVHGKCFVLRNPKTQLSIMHNIITWTPLYLISPGILPSFVCLSQCKHLVRFVGRLKDTSDLSLGDF